MEDLPEIARSSVLVRTQLEISEENSEKKLSESEESNKSSKCSLLNTKVCGYDFNQPLDYDQLLQSFMQTGFQASSFGLAVNQIEQMLDAKKHASFEPDLLEQDAFIRRKSGCTIFLGCTSNLVSSGVRESIRFLVQHRLIDVLVCSAGGIEEDIIKCLAPTYLGDFSMNGATLRSQGLNRIGNLLVPNDNYCLFEDWIMPFFDDLLDQQTKAIENAHKDTPLNQLVISPSRLIEKMGRRIDNEESILYWAAKNEIPVFCPALTDGSLGDMLYFHSFRKPGLVLDINSDIRRLNSMAVKANQSGVIILGGGMVKHHILNANLMRNGANFVVLVNTGNEFDGSDAGAKPDEAVSWGKIRQDAKPVKLHCDATIVFPLLVAQTFSKYVYQKNAENANIFS